MSCPPSTANRALHPSPGNYTSVLHTFCFLPLLSVLTSVCLQIYGFIRIGNLRKFDPAIDDPDASTWCQSSLAILDVSYSR